MAKHSYLKFIILLLIIAGCIEIEKKEYKYCIEMKPCEQGVERKLTCSGSFSYEELQRIAGLYENRINRHLFSGRFDANLPNDVGGAGFYSTFNTDMVQAAFYSERFRGNDNLYVRFNQMGQGVDQLIDFLIGWLEYELGDDPNFVNLKAFCNENIRHDIKNMVIYFWLLDNLPEYKSTGSEEILMRIRHYVIERDYPKEMLLLLEGSEETAETAYNVIRRFLAGKMGYSDPNVAAERLTFLSDTEHFEKSINRYIPTTDLYKNLWETKKIEEADPNAEPPETGDILCFVLEETWFDFDWFAPTYTIEVKLTCDSEPFASNGQWDGEAHQVVWCSSIVENENLPTFFYASWSEPNRKYQKEHFGQVVLDYKALAEYCTWRENLDEGKGKEWDSFILSLNPGEDLEGRLNAFRFSEDRQKQKESDEEESDLAKKPRELILAGLKAEKEKKEDINTQTDQE